MDAGPTTIRDMEERRVDVRGAGGGGGAAAAGGSISAGCRRMWAGDAGGLVDGPDGELRS